MWWLIGLSFSMFVLGGCALWGGGHRASEKPIVSDVSWVLPLGPREDLVHLMEKGQLFCKDRELLSYLTGLTEKLLSQVTQTSGVSSRLQLLWGPHQRIGSASLPPDRFYLAGSLLKRFQVESELAACLAIEVIALQQQWALKKLYRTRAAFIGKEHVIFSEDLLAFQRQGHWILSYEEQKAGMGSVVRILYQAGFDPRGLESYYRLLAKIPHQTVYSEIELEDLKRLAREAALEWPPLPIPEVHSSDFYAILKKVHRDDFCR